jgi:hypothetical protein
MKTNHELTIVKVFHNGETKAQFEGRLAKEQAMGFILRNQPMSIAWAIRNEGWLVQEFNEKGNFYWSEKNYGI